MSALSGEQNGLLYRSTDGGVSFSVVFQGPAEANGGANRYLVQANSGWNLVLWVNPLDANSVVGGGIWIFKSTNGGISWVRHDCATCHTIDPVTNKVTSLLSGGPVDYHQVVADPGFNNSTNRRLCAVFDQGVYRIPDISQPAIDVLSPGLGTTQFYAASVDQATGRILTASQDTGIHLFQSGQTAPEFVTAGDGGPSAIDLRDPNQYYVTTQRLEVLRVNDGTRRDFALLSGWCNGRVYDIPDTCQGKTNFLAPMVMDMRAPDRLYAGGLSLWRTNNANAPVSNTSGPT